MSARIRMRRYGFALTALVLSTLPGSSVAFAQDDGPVMAPARMPEMAPAPAARIRFGVGVNDYNNGRVRGAIVVGVFADSPATRVRVKVRQPDGSVFYRPPTTMIRGDIITRLVDAESGQSWRIAGYRDLLAALQQLPPGGRFEISGYDAGNGYGRFTAAARLNGGGGGGGGEVGESRRVHALLIADTDSQLPGLDENLRKIGSLLEPLRREGRYTPRDPIRGNRVNRGGIMAWLQDLGDVSMDTVLVYYCGHGATDVNADPFPSQKTSGHYLALTHGRPLFRSTVREALARSRPRLTIVLTECCSNVSPVAPLAAAPGMDPGLAHSLFLRTRGVVDITAATYDPRTGVEESAVTDPAGGYFTRSLEQTLVGARPADLDRDGDGLVTWAEIFPKVRLATNKEYKELRKIVLMSPEQFKPDFAAAVREQTQQRPWSFRLDGR